MESGNFIHEAWLSGATEWSEDKRRLCGGKLPTKTVMIFHVSSFSVLQHNYDVFICARANYFLCS
jgi:hypothetical protein